MDAVVSISEMLCSADLQSVHRTTTSPRVLREPDRDLRKETDHGVAKLCVTG